MKGSRALAVASVGRMFICDKTKFSRFAFTGKVVENLRFNSDNSLRKLCLGVMKLLRYFVEGIFHLMVE